MPSKPRTISPKDVDKDTAEGGYNEASEAYNLGLTTTPPPKPKPAAPKPKTASAPKKMAAGGYVGKADGCCTRGKTKVRFV